MQSVHLMGFLSRRKHPTPTPPIETTEPKKKKTEKEAQQTIHPEHLNSNTLQDTRTHCVAREYNPKPFGRRTQISHLLLPVSFGGPPLKAESLRSLDRVHLNLSIEYLRYFLCQAPPCTNDGQTVINDHHRCHLPPGSLPGEDDDDEPVSTPRHMLITSGKFG